jgi:hypothetical protein
VIRIQRRHSLVYIILQFLRLFTSLTQREVACSCSISYCTCFEEASRELKIIHLFDTILVMYYRHTGVYGTCILNEYHVSTPSLISNGYRRLFPQGVRLTSTSTSYGIKKTWIYTSASHACFVVTHWENVTFSLYWRNISYSNCMCLLVCLPPRAIQLQTLTL